MDPRVATPDCGPHRELLLSIAGPISLELIFVEFGTAGRYSCVRTQSVWCRIELGTGSGSCRLSLEQGIPTVGSLLHRFGKSKRSFSQWSSGPTGVDPGSDPNRFANDSSSSRWNLKQRVAALVCGPNRAQLLSVSRSVGLEPRVAIPGWAFGTDNTCSGLG